MNDLQDIIYKAGSLKITGPISKKVKGITMDSSKVKAGFVFVAIEGTRVDGHQYIDKAIENGATAIVCNHFPRELMEKVTYIKVNNSSEALGVMASNFYDNPSEALKLIGVTGTNGKTTIVHLLHQLFIRLGYQTGLLSTIVNKINDKEMEATRTTPDAVTLNFLLRQMVDAGCDYAFMEVSSHALVQRRTAGLFFTGAVFTNITHDHLDYHKTFSEYIKAKKLFFDGLTKSSFALTNADDKNGLLMLQNSHASRYTYGLKTMAQFKGRIIESSFEGLQMNINGNDFYSLLVGRFNASNLLAVYGVAKLLGMDTRETLIQMSSLKGAEGRFDIIRSKEGLVAIIDYAHTPDALKNVLQTINAIRTGNEELITVVGAGGDRDKTKRPEMAAIASQWSTKLILTSDNPRSEDPETILKEMKAGVNMSNQKKTLVIADRKEAIRTAFHLAQAGDIILVAGKGHEKYQEIKEVRYPLDDHKIINELFEIK